MRARSKKHFRLMLLLLIAAGGFPFLYPWGSPMLSWQDIELPELPETDLSISLPSLKPDESDELVAEQLIIYRWRDEHGSWHFSNTQPPEGVAYERMQVDANNNLFSESNGQQKERTVSRGDTQNPEKFNYSLEEISELIGAARKVRADLEAHQQKLDEGMEKER